MHSEWLYKTCKRLRGPRLGQDHADERVIPQVEGPLHLVQQPGHDVPGPRSRSKHGEHMEKREKKPWFRGENAPEISLLGRQLLVLALRSTT